MATFEQVAELNEPAITAEGEELEPDESENGAGDLAVGGLKLAGVSQRVDHDAGSGREEARRAHLVESINKNGAENFLRAVFYF